MSFVILNARRLLTTLPIWALLLAAAWVGINPALIATGVRFLNGGCGSAVRRSLNAPRLRPVEERTCPTS